MRETSAAATAALFAFAALPALAHDAPLGHGLVARLDSEGTVQVVALAQAGDGWWSLCERATGDGARWRELQAANGGANGPRVGQPCELPSAALPAGLGAAALGVLFPGDRAEAGGWRHVVTDGKVIGRAESPWTLARLFAGDGTKHAALGVAEAARARGLRPGDAVLVPREVLLPWLRPIKGSPTPPSGPPPATNPSTPARAPTAPAAPAAPVATNELEPPGAPALTATIDPAAATTTTAQDATTGTTPTEATPSATPAEAPELGDLELGGAPAEAAAAPAPDAFAVVTGTSSDDGSLAFGSDDRGSYGSYRLTPGETLYTSVVMRFTALLAGRDVNAAALRFAARSGIQDVTDIPAGHVIKIPLEDLLPQFLPKDHPRRLAHEAERAATDRLARIERRKNLSGVHVIVDSGHGGSDPGAIGLKAWEDDYAYDIACRVMSLLRDRTLATIHPLVNDLSSGHAPLARPQRDTDEVLLVTPPLRLDSGESSKVAVNLRWVLANDHRRQLLASGVPDDRIVFVSIHADSLHESARGAMAYYPAASLRLPRHDVPAGLPYTRFAEAKGTNAFAMSQREMLRAEGLSRRLGESLMAGAGRAGVLVHAYQPVRGQIVRGRPMVPAVLRYNRIPSAVLLEACNLNNPEDQRLLRDPSHRQALAAGVVDGLTEFFDGGGRAPAKLKAGSKPRTETKSMPPSNDKAQK